MGRIQRPLRPAEDRQGLPGGVAGRPNRRADRQRRGDQWLPVHQELVDTARRSVFKEGACDTEPNDHHNGDREESKCKSVAGWHDQSSSRVVAGASGLLTLIQSGHRPDR